MGRARAIKLAEEGCSSVITDINEAVASETAVEVNNRGKECLSVNCDITNLQPIKNVIDQTIRKLGRTDIFVGCAGGVPRAIGSTLPKAGERLKRGTQYSDEGHWDMMQDLNLKGHVFFCKEVAPYMIKRKFGKIRLISSQGAVTPPSPAVEYHAAKAGILGVTHNLTTELAQHNITVNCILPGPIQTPF